MPPLMCIICCDSDSPMPLPPDFVVKNGTNMCAATSSSMSEASLLISMTTASSSLA